MMSIWRSDTSLEFKRQIDMAGERLKQKIRSTNILDLPIDSHCRKRYFQPKVSSLDYWLSKYACHLFYAVSLRLTDGTLPEDIVVIDHGGGTGLLGFLAKEVGFGQVVYNDINPLFCEGATCWGKSLGVGHDSYILGDIDSVIRFFEDQPEHRRVCLISADVIEHIYDIDQFLQDISRISCMSISVLMSSGASFLNLRYVAKTLPVQRRAERKWAKERRKIIQEIGPELQSRDLDFLQGLTRGLIREDIVPVVEEYIVTGKVTRQKRRAGDFDPFSTNTCDPQTRWWAEHFLNPWTLCRQLREQGYIAGVLPGRYNVCQKNGVKRMIVRGLNSLIFRIGIAGFPICSYYILSGFKKRAVVTAGAPARAIEPEKKGTTK